MVVSLIFTVAALIVIPILYSGQLQNPSSAQDVNLQGYMLALSYSDQITAAIANVRSLMCLAKKIGGVQVVEPFVVGSLLGLNASANWTNEVTMTDIFDYEVWDHATPFNKYGKLVSFKTFLQNAPRNLLMVQYCFTAPFCYPCKHKDIVEVFCELNDFTLVGIECMNLEEEKIISFSSLKAHLYSRYSKTELVILFDVYGGIEPRTYAPNKSYRFFASIGECGRSHDVLFTGLASSQSILSDANQYIQKYLNGSSYISLMIRMEMVLKGAKKLHNLSKIAKQCFDNVLQKLKGIRKKTGLKEVFLTLDMGRYGSDIFRTNESMKVVEESAEEFLSTIYGRNISLGEWEERYISTSKLKNPGYISVVQKQIAAQGEVLVLVGPGSTYQSSARTLYENHHSKKQVFTLSQQCQ